jgi:hypothetical protein
MESDILAVKASRPPVFEITASKYSISVIPSMEWDFFRVLVDEQEASKAINIAIPVI